MNKKQSGFSVIEGLLILAIAILLGIVGWYVWHNQKSDNKSKTTSNNTANNTQESAAPLSFAEAKLPSGWSVEVQESGHVSLNNATSKCFADAFYTTDTAESNSPNVNHNKQTVDGIKAKGYAVQETSDKLTIATNKGEKQIDAQALQVTGLDNPMSQKYAYITKSDSYTQVQLSCPNQAELSTAQAALLAITFTKVD